MSVFGKLLEAIGYAESVHWGELRDPQEAGVPYITHPLAVAQLVGECCDETERNSELLEIALLHDTVESSMQRWQKATSADARAAVCNRAGITARVEGDNPWSSVAEPMFWKLRGKFGSRVSDAVFALTDVPGTRAYRRARQASTVYGDDAARVKIADKICNLRDFASTRCRSDDALLEYLQHADIVVQRSCRIARWHYQQPKLLEHYESARTELVRVLSSAPGAHPLAQIDLPSK